MATNASANEKQPQEEAPDYGGTLPDVAVGEFLNVSGHPQELDRNLGFWSICAVSVVADNAWASGAGALVRRSHQSPMLPFLLMHNRLPHYMMEGRQAYSTNS